MASQSRLSTLEYRRTITAAGIDITADVVSFAFVARGTVPATGDWHVATYEGPTTPNVWHVLVGPANSGVVLAAGVYDVWQKVADSPEVPAEPVDVLEIT